MITVYNMRFEQKLWEKLFTDHIITTHHLTTPPQTQCYDALENGHWVWIRRYAYEPIIWEDYFKLSNLQTKGILYLWNANPVGNTVDPWYLRIEIEPNILRKELWFKEAEEMKLEMNLVSFLKADDLRWVLFVKQYESYWRQRSRELGPFKLVFERGSKNEVYVLLCSVDGLKRLFKWDFFRP